MSGRYVVCDPSNMIIVGGPYVWDGRSIWTPPEEGELMTEAAAAEAGYAYPVIVASEGDGD